MLGLSWTETGLILVILFLVIRPKDIPPIIRAGKIVLAKLKEAKAEFQQFAKEISDEAGITDVKTTTHQIIGDDGTMYEAYNIEELFKQETHEQPTDPAPPSSTRHP